MFKGQPKKPLFKVGDTVHAINESKGQATDQQPPPGPQPTTPRVLSSSPIQSHFKPAPTPLPLSSGLNLPTNTLYSIISVKESTTDQQPHIYTVSPVVPPMFTLTEAQLIFSAEFAIGSFVVKKGDPTKELAVIQYVSVAVRDDVNGQQEFVVMLTVQWEIGSVAVIEADKVRLATEKEAAEWFPIGE